MAVKRNEVLIHSTMWMSLENMVGERSQSQKTIYYMIPLNWNVQKRGILRIGSRSVIAWGWGSEAVTVNGMGFLLGLMKMF